jgi:uncharacterized membrane protein
VIAVVTQKASVVRDLLAVGYPAEAKAEEVRRKLLLVQKEYLIELSDAVVAVKQPGGGARLNQILNPVVAGAASGVLWGSLIGLLFLAPLLGVAFGTASHALSGKITGLGVNDDFMRDAAGMLDTGSAVLFLLIKKMAPDKVIAELKGNGATVLRSSFDETKEKALRATFKGAQASASTQAGAT